MLFCTCTFFLCTAVVVVVKKFYETGNPVVWRGTKRICYIIILADSYIYIYAWPCCCKNIDVTSVGRSATQRGRGGRPEG